MANAIISIGKQSLMLTLLFTMITCMLLGMGLPSIPSYLITATIAAPALVKLGQPDIAAHMFCFYFAMFANLTPPVALASFAAAGLSGGSPMKTGWQSVRLALAGFIVPFMFVYNPQLLLENVTFLSGLQVVVTACTGVVLIAAAAEGYLCGRMNVVMRLLAGAGAFLLIDSGELIDCLRQGMDLASVASALDVNVNLVALRLSMPRKSGRAVDLPFTPDRRFLGRIADRSDSV